MLCIVNTGKRKKKKVKEIERESDGRSSNNNNNNSSSNNNDVMSVEHVEVKGKQQTSCGGNSPKRQEHSIVESEDRFVKFEFKPNSFHN